MSTTKVGKISPFPPLPGQPYPPARNHPRWKELYRLHDEWIMKYWPFSSEKKRARIPFMNLAGWGTWCAPAADFDRMVWGARITGIFFLTDDYLDAGKMHDRIPGFKKAATGTGPLHREDRAELCHDIVFRAIKATSHPRTFDQLVRLTHEWYDCHVREPFRNLDQYLAGRRVDIAMFFAHAYLRYTLDVNLTDEQIDHPLMREAEAIIGAHIALTNDCYSYMKEKMTNSDDANVLRLLQDCEGLNYDQAKDVVEKKIRQKEQEYISAGLAVLNDPVLGKDPEVHRWIACLPYCMGGNNAWSQETERYNVGDIPGGTPLPSLSVDAEETPADEVVDDLEESILRERIFGVRDMPPPDFTIDCDPIEEGGFSANIQSAMPMYLCLPPVIRSRPDVGILAMDVYVPCQPITQGDLEPLDGIPPHMNKPEDIDSIALSTVSSLLRKYNIDPLSIGRLEVGTETTLGNSTSVKTVLMELFKGFGNKNIEEVCSNNAWCGSTAALFNAINWIESDSWDGRNAIVFAGDTAVYGEIPGQSIGGAGGVAMLIGPNAPLVMELTHGNFMDNAHDSNRSNLESKYCTVTPPTISYLAALEESYSVYKRKRTQEVVDLYLHNKDSDSNGVNGVNGVNHNHLKSFVSLSEFDYMIYDSPDQKMAQKAHARLFYNDYLEQPDAPVYSSISASMQTLTREASLNDEALEQALIEIVATDYQLRVLPPLTLSKRFPDVHTSSLYFRLSSLIDSVPAYELFEKRVSMFAYGPGCESSFFVVRVKGDTKRIQDTMDLKARLKKMQAARSNKFVEEMEPGCQLHQENHRKVPYKPIGMLDNLWPGMCYLKSTDYAVA